jgi:beta-RFAP synthase
VTVFVEAPARLHFGMLDLGGSLGRRYGGVGAGLNTPSVSVSATPSKALRVTGESGAIDAATQAARRFLGRYAPDCGAEVTVHRTLPAHRGLGSGTQLALSTARALAELYQIPVPVADLAQVVGRAKRSAIGTYVFGLGGCVLEGGRRTDTDDPRPAPLVSRLPIPPRWRCVLAVPAARPGVSGDDEARAFATLPPPPERDAERVAHLVLMGLWPALADAEFDAFGANLSELQRINGRWFAAAQGGTFAPGPSTELIAALTAWGATGVGQSSWGPAVYALAPDEDASQELADRVRGWLAARGGGGGGGGGGGAVYDGPFSHSGAIIVRSG